MDFSFNAEEEGFRDEVREFLKRNPPENFACEDPDVGWGYGGFSRAFYKKLGEAGYLSLTWPPEYGGRGESLTKALILFEELAYNKAPMAAAQHIMTVRQLIIDNGTERARRELLPRIRNGDICLWLAYTEPDAGSDLLALTTSAREEEDYFVINGQKKWTTWGPYSDWVILLVRTDPQAKGINGLSLFLVDKSLPGVTLQPILSLAHTKSQNDLFLDEVRVHKDFLIGEKNQGRRVMFVGIESDRLWGRCMKASLLKRILGDLVCFLKEDPLGRETVTAKPWMRNAVAELAIEIEVLRVLSNRCIWMLEQGISTVREGAAIKFYADELSIRFYATLVAMFGPLGTLRDNDRLPFARDLWRYYLYSVPITVAGGTPEVLKNTIARFGRGITPS